MAIDPLNIPQQAFSSFDFTPLMQLGKQYQQQQQNQQLASLGGIYGALPADPTQATSAVPGTASGTPIAARAPISNSADLMANYGNSISNIESGGRYDLMGPAVHGGDRAIGKYQVMASNVPEWTRAALGTAMTPDQFRNSPGGTGNRVPASVRQLCTEIRPGRCR